MCKQKINNEFWAELYSFEIGMRERVGIFRKYLVFYLKLITSIIYYKLKFILCNIKTYGDE